jgi:hypothetical protein
MLAERQPAKTRRGFQAYLWHPFLNLSLASGEVLKQALLAVRLADLRRRMGRPRDLSDVLIFLSINRLSWPLAMRSQLMVVSRGR